MGAPAEWYEEFFDNTYAKVLATQFDASRTARQVDIVKRLLKLRKGQRVLDIPCGMGRLTLPLARMGLRMTGVELAASYVRRARRLAARDSLDVRFIRRDMREIDFDGEFHAAFNWFGSFGYFPDDENLAFARRVLRALRPGGRFLIETPNKSFLLSHFRGHSDDMIGGVRIVHDARFDPHTSRTHDTWTMTRAGKTTRREISIRMYNGTEMRELLREAGFRDIQLFGFGRSKPLGRFTRHSQRLLAVGRRPKGRCK
jgi:SAM-dependent methyltransferase